MKRLRTPAWWLPELRRASAAILLALPVAVVLGLTSRNAGNVGSQSWDNLVIFLFAYFIAQTSVTVVVFVTAEAREIEAWALKEERGTWLQRYVLGTAPGPGTSIFVGAAALIIAVIWLPGQVADTSTFTPLIRTLFGVALVAAAWVTVAVSFMVAYLAEDLQSGRTALGFPDASSDVDRPLTDYVYLAIAVSTTFGTTDVSLQNATVRRTATVHSVVAFLFNTVVFAVVVTVLLR